jgi:hypothetical protein
MPDGSYYKPDGAYTPAARAATEMRKLCVAGPASFYEDLLRSSEAVNAFTNNAPYASIFRERLIRLDPRMRSIRQTFHPLYPA